MHNSDKHARVIRASATIIKKKKVIKKGKEIYPRARERERESLQLRIRLPFKRERHNSKYHIWWIIRASIFTDACRREQCICSETLMYLLLCVQRWRSQTCVVCVVLHRTSIKGIVIIFRSYGYSWKTCLRIEEHLKCPSRFDDFVLNEIFFTFVAAIFGYPIV